MVGLIDDYKIMEEVRKHLDKRYGGVEGEVYEIIMHQIAPDTRDKAILLVEVETDQPFGCLQVVYVDINKGASAVTIIGDHGFPQDYAEFARNISKEMFSSTVGRLCKGWT